jgi:hypothetical protein
MVKVTIEEDGKRITEFEYDSINDAIENEAGETVTMFLQSLTDEDEE